MIKRKVALCALGIAMLTMAAGQGDGPPFDETPPPTEAILPSPDSIKPEPVAPIPDDPPPHEGAMIDLPHIIVPPDLLEVNVLEALPGRPITGERLVRPNGRISLGFYGEVHVRGLTIKQAKEKIVLHLRQYLDDETLGLVETDAADDVTKRVAPVDTSRLSVEILAFNSKFYLVDGAVVSSGRFPLTGNETVLDALKSAGVLVAKSDPREIQLLRPARGGKPEKMYKIDYAAIARGDANHNYQLFPGDRIVVGKVE